MASFLPDWVRLLPPLSLSVIAISTASGCGSGQSTSAAGKPVEVEITGKVLMDGKPLQVSEAGEIRIRFYSGGFDDPHTFTRSGDVNEKDGTFAIKRIPLGKYRVGVYQIDPPPNHDLLQGRFDRKNSLIMREVERNGQVFDIDLAKEKSSAAPSPPSKSAP